MPFDRNKYNDYVRRLGQWHLTTFELSGKTVCGKPMLSMNMAPFIEESERKKCPECFKIAEEDYEKNCKED